MSNNININDQEVKIPNFLKNFKFNFFHLILLIIFFLIALPFFNNQYSPIYQVEANENAVVTRVGKYLETTPPGLHFKLPIIDEVYKVKVDFQHKLEFGFRTLDSNVKSNYSMNGYEEESWMLTGDLKIAEVRWIVQYKISNPKDYIFNIKNVENTIKDVSESTLRTLVGDRLFDEVLQKERTFIASEAKKNIQKKLDFYDSGISVQLVQLQGVVPPGPVADSFDEVNRANQDKETLKNEADKEYNKVIYKAQGEAQKVIADAEGYKVERINRAQGDANLFLSILKEYNLSPEVTKDRLYLEMMEEVLSNNKNKIIIDKDIENFVPFLNQNKSLGK